MNQKSSQYRIQLTVAVYKDKKLVFKNELTVPSHYRHRSEAREHIKKEIQSRLEKEHFFRSPRADFDLVRYEEEATRNTYIRYRIIEEEQNTGVSSRPDTGQTITAV